MLDYRMAAEIECRFVIEGVLQLHCSTYARKRGLQNEETYFGIYYQI